MFLYTKFASLELSSWKMLHDNCVDQHYSLYTVAKKQELTELCYIKSLREKEFQKSILLLKS